MAQKCNYTGKTSFHSKRSAREFINAFANKMSKEGYLREFYCSHCNGWHVTHQHPFMRTEPVEVNNEAFRKYMEPDGGSLTQEEV